MLYDHVDLRVDDLTAARKLYDALLPAMGYTRIVGDESDVCYYQPSEDRSLPFLGLTSAPGHEANASRIALRAGSRAEVDRLAGVALAAGAHVFEPPQLCAEYTPAYYATFFEDAAGNKLEICHRGPS